MIKHKGLFTIIKFLNINNLNISGTLSNNLSQLVRKFKNGIAYTAEPHKSFKEYGLINVTFGLVNS